MFHKNLTRIRCTLCEDYWTFFVIFRSFLLIMRNISEKAVEEIKIHFVLITCFENRAFYEIMWKNIVQRTRRQIIIWRMRIACWMTKATNTHSEYVILIAVPLQQRLHERASVLRYTYIAGLVNLRSIWRCIISFTARSL